VRHRPLPVTIVISVWLAACGSDSDSPVPDATSFTTGTALGTDKSSPVQISPLPGSTSARFNDADVFFTQNIVANHEQAITIADFALEPGSGASSQVRDLAERIKAGQDVEVSLLSGWLDDWHHPAGEDHNTTHPGDLTHDGEISPVYGGAGMLSTEELDQLIQLNGKDFDQAWLRAMISHHQGAISLAGTVADDGDNVEVRALAAQEIATHGSEVEEMNRLLAP